MLLKNSRVVDPTQNIDEIMDLYIENGVIKEMDVNLDISCKEVLDLTGFISTPGLIDMHVHLREPGREDKETIETGTRAAAAGGFTAVACMPNTDPPNDNQSVTDFILKQNRKAGYIHVYPVGCISKAQKGESISEMAEMKEAGIVAVSDDGVCVQNNELMRIAMEYAHSLGLIIIDHCEDRDLTHNGVMNEGYISTLLGLDAIPSAAEDIMVSRDIILSELTGVPIHLAHVSTKGSVELIKNAKQYGLKVTAEVTPHHLILQDTSVRSFDSNYKMNPPLRAFEDTNSLVEALADGTIDVIATDHAPHTVADKEMEFAAAPFGIIGLETAVSLIVDKLVNTGKLTWTQFVEKFSTNPARILGVKGGTLKVGSVADITVIDPEKTRIIDVKSFFSKSKNSPFHGWELKGAPVYTVVEGQVIYNGMERTVISRKFKD